MDRNVTNDYEIKSNSISKHNHAVEYPQHTAIVLSFAMAWLKVSDETLRPFRSRWYR